MARPDRDKFILGLTHADPESVGVQLAKVCVRAELPSLYIAEVFNVSRMSIHSWFRGGVIRDKNSVKIERFIELIEEDLANGSLPAMNLPHARTYLESEIKPKLDAV